MIKEMETYAKENRVPIMLPDGIDYLCNYIKEHNVKRILEIGSAIGYSAIRMALVSDDITITTIEKDPVRYSEAVKNIHKCNLDKRINIILDAKDVEEEYANICNEIQETVEMFGDRIDDTIVRDLKDMIKKVASHQVRETLEHKLHFADTIESYKEIYDIATREQGNNLQNR